MKHYLLFLIINLFFFNLNAQDTLKLKYWTGGTALTLNKHRFELGIFDESRYGLTDKIEISSHLITFFLMPNLKVKKFWGSFHGFDIASSHGFLYPSPLLRTIARKGTGGFISPEFHIPDMVSINNHLIVSCTPFKNTILSVYTGFNFAINFGELDERTTIDLPYIYPRLAVFYNQPEIDAGIDFKGSMTKCFGWIVQLDNFWFFNTSENYFSENNFCLTYTSRKKNLRIESGSKLCFGRYIPGPQWHLIPMLLFGFKL